MKMLIPASNRITPINTPSTTAHSSSELTADPGVKYHSDDHVLHPAYYRMQHETTPGGCYTFLLIKARQPTMKPLRQKPILCGVIWMHKTFCFYFQSTFNF